MHSTFAFNIAKNGVNGMPGVRRAATATQLGKLSSPSSPVPPESGTSGWSCCDDENVTVATSLATMPRVASSPTAFVDVGGKDVDVTRKGEVGEDLVHRSKRGASVDKTNPFIGYFQTRTKESDVPAGEGAPEVTTKTSIPTPAVPMRRVPCRTQSSTALSSITSFYSTAYLTPQKNQITEWKCRLPTLFQHKYAKKSKQHEQQQQKRGMLLDPLKLKSQALAVHATTDKRLFEDKRQNAPFKRTVPLSTTMASNATSAAVTPSFESKISLFERSRASNSRFKQDFDVMGTLGEGGQGSVYKVRSKVDGCYYAVKKVVLPRATALKDGSVESQALREVHLMASMGPHPNLVRYHTAWTETIQPASQTIVSSESSETLSLETGYEPQDFQHQLHLQLVDEEEEDLHRSSTESEEHLFSLPFSSESLRFDEDSTLGFTFDDDESSETFCSNNEASVEHPSERKDKKQNVASNGSAKTAASTSQVILYIQMELCGTGVNAVPSSQTIPDESGPIHRILSQLKTPQREKEQDREETPSNLAAWLRSSLQERLSLSNMSKIHQEGLQLFLGAVQGVAHMHSYGVIHRDLKPDNIFIHGKVAKIGDFGLSKSVFEDTTTNGSVSLRAYPSQLEFNDGNHTTALGTFTYASPEQLGYRFSASNAIRNAATRLKSAKYSIKSDIFALGVILLELCCPFATMMERSQVLTGVRHGVVPQKARQLFPMEMELVLRMTAIDPNERPTSDEVCEQLRQIIAASNPSITPASVVEELHAIQTKLAAAVRSVRDRSHAALQLEALVSELNDKVQSFGIALA